MDKLHDNNEGYKRKGKKKKKLIKKKKENKTDKNSNKIKQASK